MNLAEAFRLFGLLLILLNVTVSAIPSQDQEDDCADPVYKINEVSKRAKLTRVSEPAYTEEARVHQVRGKVVITAVLCRTGKVTNIEVIESLPYGLTENAIESTRKIEFEPAEKDGQTVSQHIRRECMFDLY